MILRKTSNAHIRLMIIDVRFNVFYSIIVPAYFNRNSQIDNNKIDELYTRGGKALYNDVVLDHFSNLRNLGEIVEADRKGCVGNPVDGDKINIPFDTCEAAQIC